MIMNIILKSAKKVINVRFNHEIYHSMYDKPQIGDQKNAERC